MNAVYAIKRTRPKEAVRVIPMVNIRNGLTIILRRLNGFSKTS